MLRLFHRKNDAKTEYPVVEYKRFSAILLSEAKLSDFFEFDHVGRTKERHYNFMLFNSQFKYEFTDTGISIKKIEEEKASELVHPNVEGVLGISSLNHVITLSLSLLRVWIFENGNFVCVLSQPITDLVSFQDKRKVQLKNCSPKIDELKISPDNRLIAARINISLDSSFGRENANILFLFDILTNKFMLHDLGHYRSGAKFTRLTALSSSRVVISERAGGGISIRFLRFNLSKNEISDAALFIQPCDFDPGVEIRSVENDHVIFHHGVIFLHRNAVLFSDFYSKQCEILYQTTDEIILESLHLTTDGTYLIILGSEGTVVKLQLISTHSEKQEVSNKNGDILGSALDFQLGCMYMDRKRQKMLDNTLAIYLPMFSLDLVSLVAGYCISNTYQLDARLLAPQILYDLTCKMQLDILGLLESLLKRKNLRKQGEFDATIMACSGQSYAEITALYPYAVGFFSKTDRYLKAIEEASIQRSSQQFKQKKS